MDLELLMRKMSFMRKKLILGENLDWITSEFKKAEV